MWKVFDYWVNSAMRLYLHLEVPESEFFKGPLLYKMGSPMGTLYLLLPTEKGQLSSSPWATATWRTMFLGERKYMDCHGIWNVGACLLWSLYAFPSNRSAVQPFPWFYPLSSGQESIGVNEEEMLPLHLEALQVAVCLCSPEWFLKRIQEKIWKASHATEDFSDIAVIFFFLPWWLVRRCFFQHHRDWKRKV